MQQKQKGRKTRVALLLIIWILLFATSIYLIESLLTAYVDNPQGYAIVISIWSGYLVTPDSRSPESQVVGINVSWTVTRLKVTSTYTYSAAWIEIGGNSHKTLFQVGTEHDSINGQEYYSAWLELTPDKAIRITEMRVSAGETIIASIPLVN